MQFVKWIRILPAIVLFALPQASVAFQGKRGTTVNAINDTAFEVIARTAGSAQDYWCGAADFALTQLRASWSAEIRIIRGRGPSETSNRRSAVQFTLISNEGLARSGNRSALQFGSLQVGDTLRVRSAYQFCVQPVGRR